MKAVTLAAGLNPTQLPNPTRPSPAPAYFSPPSARGRPLRLISSFTQWQSGDMIRQLFAANRAAPHSDVKSISSEPPSNVVSVAACRKRQEAGAAILCLSRDCSGRRQCVHEFKMCI